MKPFLDKLEKRYSTIGSIRPDPLQFVHEYDDPRDMEVIAVIASSLAYGKVKQIIRSIGAVADKLGKSPYKFVKRFDPKTHAARFHGFKHRFSTGEDIACLLFLMKGMMDKGSTIGGFFMAGYDEGSETIEEALESYCSRALFDLDPGPFYGKRRLPASGQGVRYFFPLPSKGSACKRLNLMLRWMVRTEGVDIGLWKWISPNKLIIPLDTHVARISRYLGLTDRKSADFKTALEVTRSLKALDAGDPVRYDFAIARLGILDRCPSRPRHGMCDNCDLLKICDRPG